MPVVWPLGLVQKVVYLAVAEGPSETDRAPVLQDVWDRLRPTGVTINLVGRPGSDGANMPRQVPPNPGSAPGATP